MVSEREWKKIIRLAEGKKITFLNFPLESGYECMSEQHEGRGVKAWHLIMFVSGLPDDIHVHMFWPACHGCNDRMVTDMMDPSTA